ncbi:AAA family ATPase [Nocardia acidivorans]|uniref:AAA family ATPase n=1 Tax=Nocardia acidivorans TaxID=404580 RepID=UPI0008295075|nr:AAA family ATPase [Nocardia acidivorans]
MNAEDFAALREEVEQLGDVNVKNAVLQQVASQIARGLVDKYTRPLETDDELLAKEVARQRRLDKARRTVAAENNVRPAIAPGIGLDEFLAIEDEPEDYRIAGLLPTDGKVLLSAAYKAGKTTMVGNLTRSLVDGRPFLGKFETRRLQGRLAIIDNEMNPRALRSWLRRIGILSPEKVVLWSLKGRVSSFDLLDSETRAKWSDHLAEEGVEFVILDCLRPVLDSLGLDEHREAGKFLVPFDEMLARAGVREGVIVQHMGHTGERARGDSRLLDWPDVNWTLVRAENENPASPRFFTAYGRDVDVPQSGLDFTPETGELTYLANRPRRQTAAEKLLPAVLKVVREKPNLTGRAIINLLTDDGVSQSGARTVLELSRARGFVLTEEGAEHSKLHFLNPSRSGDIAALLDERV